MLVGGKTVMKDVTIWSQGRPVKESRKRAGLGATAGLIACYVLAL